MKEIELTVSFGFLGQGIIPIHRTAMLKRYNDCCIGYYIKDYEGNYHLVDWFMESRDTFAYIYGDVHNINYNRFYYNKEKKEYTGLEGFTLDYNRTERPWYRSYMKFSTAKFKDKNTLLVWDEFKQQQQEINLPELKRRREELFKELIEDEKFLNDFQNDK